MQKGTRSVTDNQRKTNGEPPTPENKLEGYLHHMQWHTTTFPYARLECMLAASCLRYLGTLCDIDFVVGLAQAIQRKYSKKGRRSLWQSINILNELPEKLREKRMLATEKEGINELVNDAQAVITKRKIPPISLLG